MLETWQLTTAIIGVFVVIAIAMISGFWTISQGISARFKEQDERREEDIKTFFRRTDEMKKGALEGFSLIRTECKDTFVDNKIYQNDLKHASEKIDFKMQGLTDAIKRIEDFIKENISKKEGL